MLKLPSLARFVHRYRYLKPQTFNTRAFKIRDELVEAGLLCSKYYITFTFKIRDELVEAGLLCSKYYITFTFKIRDELAEAGLVLFQVLLLLLLDDLGISLPR